MPVGAAVGFVLPVALDLRPMLYFHLAWSALFPVRTKRTCVGRLLEASLRGSLASPSFSFERPRQRPRAQPGSTTRRGENFSGSLYVTVLPRYPAWIETLDPGKMFEKSQKGPGWEASGS